MNRPWLKYSFMYVFFCYYRGGYCIEEKQFELLQQHEPEEAQFFIKYADNVNGESIKLSFLE